MATVVDTSVTQAVLTRTGVLGAPVETSGVDIFAINVVAGNTYTVDMNTISGAGAMEVADTTNFITRADLLGNFYIILDTWHGEGNVTFTASTTETLYLGGYATGDYAAAKYTVSLAVIEAVIPVSTLIDEALASAKTYIDAQDVSVKAYADSLINQLTSTTDLSAKLDLLNQINGILDGDAATAGLQAWQSSLVRLNNLESGLSTLDTSTTAKLLVQRNEYIGGIDAANTWTTVKFGEANASIKALKAEKDSEFKMIRDKAAILFAV